MMICKGRHETFSPPHPMIFIVFTLFHLVSSVVSNLSSHFTPCILHQPRAILQSSIPTLKAYASYKQRSYVPCFDYGH
jgi:hypothetical protein